MPNYRDIRADYDAHTIVVYQAYRKGIADAAVAAGKFVAPFSLNRMTWIKPSFLWMMERSNWGLKSGQEHIIAIRITRAGWEEALSLSVLTHPDESVYHDVDEWRRCQAEAQVQVQWDPERGMRGESLEYRSIQVGLSRHVVDRYVNAWTQEIRDLTPTVRKMHDLIQSGQSDKAKSFLPPERVYPVPEPIARRLGMG